MIDFVRRHRMLTLLSFILALALGSAVYAATVMTKVNLTVTMTGLFENSLDQVNAQYPFKVAFDDSMTDGNAADKAEVVFYNEDTVAASGTDTLDFAGGFTDAFGTTLTCTKLKALWIENRNTTAGDIIRLQRPAANGLVLFDAASDAINIGPGGAFLWWLPSAAGIAVTAGTGDILEIVEEGGANVNTYRIAFVCTDT